MLRRILPGADNPPKPPPAKEFVRRADWRRTVFHPPTQETTALAVEECVTSDRNPFSDGSAMLRRISLTGGWPAEALA